MRRHLAFAAAVILWSAAAASAQAGWIFLPSSFSHDPASGQRVVQFAPAETAWARIDTTYQQSAFRHNRNAIHIGDSYDYFHIVETWGAGESIRPYGEWEYPYRPGATPYGPWGNPQGPWTTPFGAWANPYGLGRLPNPGWQYGPSAPNSPPYAAPNPPPNPGAGPGRY